MQTSLNVTFFRDMDKRQYRIDIDRNDDYTEVYISRSAVLESNPGDHNAQESYESATFTWSDDAMVEYFHAAPTLFPPTINGILNLVDSLGPEWAGIFKHIG